MLTDIRDIDIPDAPTRIRYAASIAAAARFDAAQHPLAASPTALAWHKPLDRSVIYKRELRHDQLVGPDRERWWSSMFTLAFAVPDGIEQFSYTPREAISIMHRILKASTADMRTVTAMSFACISKSGTPHLHVLTRGYFDFTLIDHYTTSFFRPAGTHRRQLPPHKERPGEGVKSYLFDQNQIAAIRTLTYTPRLRTITRHRDSFDTVIANDHRPIPIADLAR
jgi:hypothetical protein